MKEQMDVYFGLGFFSCPGYLVDSEKEIWKAYHSVSYNRRPLQLHKNVIKFSCLTGLVLPFAHCIVFSANSIFEHAAILTLTKIIMFAEWFIKYQIFTDPLCLFLFFITHFSLLPTKCARQRQQGGLGPF